MSWFSIKRRPNAADAMRRAIILKHVFVKALATPGADVMENLSDEQRRDLASACQTNFNTQVEKLRAKRLWSHMNEDERQFMQAGVAETTEQQRIDASWLAESMACLFWALGYIPHLPAYDEETSHELIRKLPPFDSNDEVIKNATLIAPQAINEQRELAELWHWRCRTRTLLESGQVPPVMSNGVPMDDVINMAATKASGSGAFAAPIAGDFPAMGKAFRDLTPSEFAQTTSIAQERHRALNWLCGYAPGNQWADTPTDT